MEWFRLWHDFFNDPKLNRLTKAQRYDLLHLFRLASGNAVRGQVDLDDDDIASTLEMTDGDFEEFMDFLTRKHIVCRTPAGHPQFIHWPERQPVSDSAASRMRAYRERQKRNSSDDSDEPLRNGDVTVTDRTEQRREEQIISEERETRAHSKPPSLETFLSHAGNVGIDAVSAEKCWNHHEVKGWPNGGAKWDLVLKNWHLTDVQRKQDQIPSRNGGGRASGFHPEMPASLVKYGKETLGLTDEQIVNHDFGPDIRAGKVRLR